MSLLIMLESSITIRYWNTLVPDLICSVHLYIYITAVL